MRRIAARAADALDARDAGRLTDAYARSLFRLMAVKDEYEVARLHASKAFRDALDAQFEGDWRLAFHLAPPLLAHRHPSTGRPLKRTFGAWLMPVLRGLAALRRGGGPPLDPFGWTHERRGERALLRRYQAAMERVAARLTPDRIDTAVAIAALPDIVRGFGHVKAAALTRFDARLEQLLRELEAPSAAVPLQVTELAR